jgi:hypothetical protein
MTEQEAKTLAEQAIAVDQDEAKAKAAVAALVASVVVSLQRIATALERYAPR